MCSINSFVSITVWVKPSNSGIVLNLLSGSTLLRSSWSRKEVHG